MCERTWPIETQFPFEPLAKPSRSIYVWEDVAQLKRITQLPLQKTQTFSIHVWKDVAQLKLILLILLGVLKPFPYPFLLRSGPIETWPLKISALTNSSLSISAKKWPNWNTFGDEHLRNPLYLSISAKKWPNWNSSGVIFFFRNNMAIHFC